MSLRREYGSLDLRSSLHHQIFNSRAVILGRPFRRTVGISYFLAIALAVCQVISPRARPICFQPMKMTLGVISGMDKRFYPSISKISGMNLAQILAT